MPHSSTFHNICIFGNIASGKSTLTEYLSEAIPHSVAIPEEFHDNPFLALYVADPKRWGFTNAVRYFYDYARAYHKRTAGQTFAHVFIDAGGTTNRDIYAPYLKQAGIVTPEEDAFHTVLCELVEREFEYPPPDAYIYVRASPERCFERMKQRGWDYQTAHIAQEYLKALKPYFDGFAAKLRKEGAPLLELDSDALDFTTEEGKRVALERVREFVKGG